MTSDATSPGDSSRPPDAPAGRSITVRDAQFEIAPHNCFACGSLNAGGLQLALHSGGDRCWIETVIPARFEGWEGLAHGGIVCAILDEVMAWALIDRGAWSVTARMAVEFRAPVRVGVRIRCEGWVTDARRRLLSTAGQLVDATTGDVLATATAVYVAAPEEKKRQLKERYGIRRIADDGEEAPA